MGHWWALFVLILFGENMSTLSDFVREETLLLFNIFTPLTNLHLDCPIRYGLFSDNSLLFIKYKIECHIIPKEREVYKNQSGKLRSL